MISFILGFLAAMGAIIVVATVIAALIILKVI
jgi:hypothetical protein